MGSVIQRGANVEGVLAAGSIVKENTEIKQGEVVDYNNKDLGWKSCKISEGYQSLGTVNLEGIQIRISVISLNSCGRVWEEQQISNEKINEKILNDADNRLEYQTQSYEEAVLQKLAEMNFPLE